MGSVVNIFRNEALVEEVAETPEPETPNLTVETLMGKLGNDTAVLIARMANCMHDLASGPATQERVVAAARFVADYEELVAGLEARLEKK